MPGLSHSVMTSVLIMDVTYSYAYSSLSIHLQVCALLPRHPRVWRECGGDWQWHRWGGFQQRVMSERKAVALGEACMQASGIIQPQTIQVLRKWISKEGFIASPANGRRLPCPYYEGGGSKHAKLVLWQRRWMCRANAVGWGGCSWAILLM